MTQADKANDLAIMVSETYLAWSEPTRAQYTIEPAGSTAGVLLNGGSSYVTGTPRCRVVVQMWEIPGGRSARMTVSNFSSLDVYEVTVSGVSYNTALPATEADMWSALESAINGDAGRVVDATAGATYLDLVFKSDAVAPVPNWSLDWLVTSGGGSAAFAAVAEPTYLEAYVMGYPGTLGAGPSTLSGWQAISRCQDDVGIVLDSEPGYHESWPTGGMQRLAVYTHILRGEYSDHAEIELTPYRVAIGVSKVSAS